MKDPLFDTNDDVPFVSSTAHSRLLIRAVLRKDKNLLKKLIDDRTQVHSLEIQRSMQQDRTPLDYAIRSGDVQLIKSLLNELKPKKGYHPKSRVGAPTCMLEVVEEPITSSGTRISMRGSREALWNKASAEIPIPGAMMPPTYSLSPLIASNVVAVPKSTITIGP